MPERVHILAIECSNPGASGGGGLPGVALGAVRDGAMRVLGVQPVRPSGRGGQDDDLLPAIDRVFRGAGVDVRAGTLRAVAVSVGPGGYTSVRVACAAGKMIAEATGAACIAVPTASVAMAGVTLEDRVGITAVALAGKGASAWVRVFEGGEAREAGRVIVTSDVGALHEAGVRRMVADEHLPAAIRGAAAAVGIAIVPLVLSAEACLRACMGLPEIDPAELAPVYPREPDAVALWRNRRGA